MYMHILARSGLALIMAVSPANPAATKLSSAENEEPPSNTRVTVLSSDLNVDSPHFLVITVGESLQSIKNQQSKAVQDALEASQKERVYDLSSIQQIARGLCDKEFGDGQFEALNRIVIKESGWNPRAKEPRTGAYGLGQALPASKMAPFGADYLTNPETQLKWLMAYIKGRYGTPNGALEFHKINNWY